MPAVNTSVLPSMVPFRRFVIDVVLRHRSRPGGRRSPCTTAAVTFVSVASTVAAALIRLGAPTFVDLRPDRPRRCARRRSFSSAWTVARIRARAGSPAAPDRYARHPITCSSARRMVNASTYSVAACAGSVTPATISRNGRRCVQLRAPRPRRRRRRAPAAGSPPAPARSSRRRRSPPRRPAGPCRRSASPSTGSGVRRPAPSWPGETAPARLVAGQPAMAAAADAATGAEAEPAPERRSVLAARGVVRPLPAAASSRRSPRRRRRPSGASTDSTTIDAAAGEVPPGAPRRASPPPSTLRSTVFTRLQFMHGCVRAPCPLHACDGARRPSPAPA